MMWLECLGGPMDGLTLPSTGQVVAVPMATRAQFAVIDQDAYSVTSPTPPRVGEYRMSWVARKYWIQLRGRATQLRWTGPVYWWEGER